MNSSLFFIIFFILTFYLFNTSNALTIKKAKIKQMCMGEGRPCMSDSNCCGSYQCNGGLCTYYGEETATDEESKNEIIE